MAHPTEGLAPDDILVRNLEEADLDSIVKIDELAMGHARPDFYRTRIGVALRDREKHPTLVAVVDKEVVGFLMATMQRGEFGRPEATAVIDAVGVHRDHRRRKVARALMDKLLLDVRALGASTVRTEVEWNDFDLVRFFSSQGFAPAYRILLERSP
ncbi:MAG: GNAT family N-acetyltransferase [Deltaproteobacteria bacterium]|nr:GNAT family N-acetyltransferase [Deltaproteobacteria bacterium]